jgi:hypothetical protein
MTSLECKWCNDILTPIYTAFPVEHFTTIYAPHLLSKSLGDFLLHVLKKLFAFK